MSYDKPNRIKYTFAFDAGNNGDDTFTVYGPKGKAGRLWDYGVECITEAFTSGGSLAIGDGSDPNRFGLELSTGATAADGKLGVRALYDEVADAASFDALMVDRNIPADTAVTGTIVDDSATGIGVYFVIVDWDD